SSYRFQQAFEKKEKQMVGVNVYAETDEAPFPILYIDDRAHEMQIGRLADLRRTRDNAAVARTLEALAEVARGTANTMYPLIDCVRAYATVGEMCDALRAVWGEYEEVPSI
ncbi:MAG: methylmalonyl-CoA mutase, partial [Acidobacteria bacterium 37-65-4]